MATSWVATNLSGQSQSSGGVGLSSWERFSFAVARTVCASLVACLSITGLHRFGYALGTLEWLVNYKRRKRVAATIRSALGAMPSRRELRRTTREHFCRSRSDKLLFLVFDRIPRDEAMSLLSVSNQELLDDALARGRGVYMAMSHHGPLHLLAMLLTVKGYKTAGVRDRREGALRRYVQDRFDRLQPEFGRMRVFFADAYPREIYRCLKAGYLLGSAMDVTRVRHPKQKSEEVTIFGQKRRFLTGPLRIAIRCGAPVLQAFIVPEDRIGYRLKIVTTLVDPEEVTDEDAAVAQAMRTYAKNVEVYVRASPALVTRL